MYKTYNCIVCNTESRFRHSKLNLYCGIACQQAKQTQDLIENWLSGGPKSVWKYSIPAWAKRYLIETRGHRCEICEKKTHMTQPIPLEVDHIDGNNQDNRLENLRLICPNCHAQTDTYKSKNYGNGRSHRRKHAGVA
jgi:5-methylcytosine-specific restriction endonuclease McrA